MNVVRNTRFAFGKLLCAAVFAVSLLSVTASAHAALGVDFSQNVSYENGGALAVAGEPYTIVGWSFMPARDLYLTRLGMWDQDVEKRHSESHLVGIWGAEQNLLASVTIDEPQGAVHEMVTGNFGAQYHFEDLATPLLISKGSVYFVGATLFAQAIGATLDFDAIASFGADDASLYNFTVNSDLVFLANAYSTSSSNQLVFPGQVDGVSDYLFGANVEVTPTPLPAAAWLLGSGLLGLVGIRRRTGCMC